MYELNKTKKIVRNETIIINFTRYVDGGADYILFLRGEYVGFVSKKETKIID